MESVAGTLGLNWQGLVWHAINFIVLLLLLRLVLYKPVLGMLDNRARRVRDSMDQADRARRAAEQAESDRQALLADTRREAEQMRARAEEQANRIIAQAEAQTEQMRNQTMAEVRAQIADLIVVAVDRVTRHALDASAQRNLVQQFLSTE